jgi:DNA-binding NarL/FixJ family response regulator
MFDDAAQSENRQAIAVVVVHAFPVLRLGLRALGEADSVFRVVGEAAGPDEGIGLIASRRPSVVVLDMKFPGRSGFDVLRDTRVAFPRLKIVVYSDVPGADFSERCLRAGADGYVDMVEPIDHFTQAICAVHRGKIYLSPDRSSTLLGRLTREGPAALQSPVERLSEGEFGVLNLIAQGMSNRQIAVTLHRSIKTVETYRSRIKRKVGAANSTALAQFAVRQLDRNVGPVHSESRARLRRKSD